LKDSVTDGNCAWWLIVSGALVVETFVFGLERRDHREDRLAILIGLRAAGGERPAVMDAVDREGDRLLGVARAQEVAVHRVHGPILGHGADRGDQRLREHLPADHPTAGSPLTRPGEDVFTGSGSGVGQIERGEKSRQGVGHGL